MKACDEEKLCEILINTTDEMALKELFESRTQVCDKWLGHNSSRTGALEDLIRRLDGRHAVDYIPYALKLTLEQDEKDKFVTALALTRNLIRKSNTTEILENFLIHKDEIEKRINDYNDRETRMLWNGIISWNRNV